MTHRIARQLTLASSFGALAMLCACAGPLNRETQVGQGTGAWTPPTLLDYPETVARANAEDPNPAEPSARTLDRSHWPVTLISVPNDLTAHQPRYTKPWFDNERPDATARAIGIFPTAKTALDVPGSEAGGGGAESQVREAVVAPLGSALEIVLWPIRAVNARPWQRTRTGLEPYERVPHAKAPVPAAAESAEEPPRAPMPPAEPMHPESGSPGSTPWAAPAPVTPSNPPTPPPASEPKP